MFGRRDSWIGHVVAVEAKFPVCCGSCAGRRGRFFRAATFRIEGCRKCDANVHRGHRAGRLRKLQHLPSRRRRGAVPEYENALKKDPEDYVAHSDLGWILFLSGQPAAATAHLREALRINPNDEKTRDNLRRIEADQAAQTGKTKK